jgi:DNA gyrase subunit B
MPLLIDRGHVFIAQPPLFRAKRGRTETYIKDEREPRELPDSPRRGIAGREDGGWRRAVRREARARCRK